MALLGHILAEGIAGQLLAVGVEQLGPGEVDFLNEAVFVEGDVAQRGEVVEIDVAVAIGFEMPLRRPQLLVLLFQFALMDFDLV